MKNKSLAFTLSTVAAAALFALPALARDEKMTLDQVPAPVRETIQKEVGDGKLDSIEKETEEGKPPVYEVEYTTKKGDDFEIKIAEDGKLLDKHAD